MLPSDIVSFAERDWSALGLLEQALSRVHLLPGFEAELTRAHTRPKG